MGRSFFRPSGTVSGSIPGLHGACLGNVAGLEAYQAGGSRRATRCRAARRIAGAGIIKSAKHAIRKIQIPMHPWPLPSGPAQLGPLGRFYVA